MTTPTTTPSCLARAGKMATTCCSWSLVAGSEPDHACNQANFLSALKVWLYRPQVVNKRLLAAVVHEDPLEWSTRERLLSEEVSSCSASVSSRVFVRELLPKSTRLPSGRELVVIGELAVLMWLVSIMVRCATVDDQQVTFWPTSAPGDCERHCYRVKFTPAELSSTSCSLGLYIQHSPSEGVWLDHAFLGTTHPTLKWLTSVLLPKLAKWMCDGGGSGLTPSQDNM